MRARLGSGNRLLLRTRGNFQVRGIDAHERLAPLDGLPGIDEALQDLPGHAEARSLCTRAATIPVNERSVWTAACTVSIRTRGLCVRGSSEEPECVHAAKAKGSRPTTVRNEASRRLRMETSVRR